MAAPAVPSKYAPEAADELPRLPDGVTQKSSLVCCLRRVALGFFEQK
ncbi:MAG TPA: hypothetical protein VJ398_08210 [Acidimicrobiia bacterium]|nr:hypothetical protein [Acidimicrobiia bacterium]